MNFTFERTPKPVEKKRLPSSTKTTTVKTKSSWSVGHHHVTRKPSSQSFVKGRTTKMPSKASPSKSKLHW